MKDCTCTCIQYFAPTMLCNKMVAFLTTRANTIRWFLYLELIFLPRDVRINTWLAEEATEPPKQVPKIQDPLFLFTTHLSSKLTMQKICETVQTHAWIPINLQQLTHDILTVLHGNTWADLLMKQWKSKFKNCEQLWFQLQIVHLHS
jgi:hypothetical protein